MAEGSGEEKEGGREGSGKDGGKERQTETHTHVIDKF